MYVAAKAQNKLLIDNLVGHGAKVDFATKKGDTPLLALVKARNLILITEMVEHGADINYCDPSGRNCLHWAVNSSDTGSDASNEIENYLLKMKVDYNKKDKHDRIPLHYAFVKIGNPFSTCELDPIETVSNILS